MPATTYLPIPDSRIADALRMTLDVAHTVTRPVLLDVEHVPTSGPFVPLRRSDPDRRDLTRTAVERGIAELLRLRAQDPDRSLLPRVAAAARDLIPA